MADQIIDEDLTQRFRLIPTRGRDHHSWFVFGEQAAIQSAKDFVEEQDMPVLICSHNEGSYSQRYLTMSPPEKSKR